MNGWEATRLHTSSALMSFVGGLERETEMKQRSFECGWIVLATCCNAGQWAWSDACVYIKAERRTPPNIDWLFSVILCDCDGYGRVEAAELYLQ